MPVDNKVAVENLTRLGLQDYFLYPQIHFGPKSDSLRAIAQKLNIGLNTFAFVDDQPFEREEVGQALPEVLRLDAAEMSAIPGLPRFILLAGARFVHGFPPDSVTTYLFQAADDRLASWFDRGESLTFVGHTHELMLLLRDGAGIERRELGSGRIGLANRPCIVNAGSVGQPRDGNNNAKYLIWDTDGNTVDVRFVPYDIAATVAKIRERGFPEFYGSRLW